jgi:hypothetical protein
MPSAGRPGGADEAGRIGEHVADGRALEFGLIEGQDNSRKQDTATLLFDSMLRLILCTAGALGDVQDISTAGGFGVRRQASRLGCPQIPQLGLLDQAKVRANGAGIDGGAVDQVRRAACLILCQRRLKNWRTLEHHPPGRIDHAVDQGAIEQLTGGAIQLRQDSLRRDLYPTRKDGVQRPECDRFV